MTTQEISELTPRVRFRASYETEQLVKRLTEFAKEGDTEKIITYDELSKVAGRNVKSVGRGLLTTARRTVERESHVIFVPVDGKGLKLANIQEQCAIPAEAIKGIKRKTKRALERMSRAQYDKMSNEQKLHHNVGASLLGAVAMFTENSAVRRMEDKRPENKPLDLSETLKLFGP